ncbi:hypothetical protein CRYUN_Cryun37aG0031900 [Craigia yunnanensis]
MALARLALRNLQQRVSSSSSFLGHNLGKRSASGVQRQRWNDEILKRFMATATDKVSDEEKEGKKVSVSEEFFPSGLGNALLQATENINRLFDNLNLTPSQLMGRVKEQEDCYKLRYDVPGLTKEDVKITIDDGVLTIKGEHKEEEEGSDDEQWSTRSYGYYNTSLVLPDDAKVDEIKAELKDGVLSIIIPRTEQPKKDVKEVQIH